MKLIVTIISLFMLTQPATAAEDINNLIRQAEAGNADAQFRLVKAYGQGIGVSKDSNKAKHWFSKAAENGHAEAEYWTGYNYFYGQNIEKNLGKALEWYERSANKGYGPAQFMAGYIYQMGHLLGDSIRPNLAKAINWYQLAVAQGEMGAQFHFGCFKYFGIGVDKNVVEADLLIQKAAAKGQRGAQQFLQSKGEVGEKGLLQICDIYPNIYL